MRPSIHVAWRRALIVPGLTALLSMSTLTAPASAATCDRFASRSGSDTNPGTESGPFRTAQKLVDSLSAGQTGCLRAGEYTTTNTYLLRFGRSGTPGSPISVRSYPGERARLLGIVTVPSGINQVRLAHVDIEGTGVQNTVKIYGADVVIENNDITNRMRGGSCMILGSTSGGRALRPVIRRNFFHDCGATANDNKDHSIYASAVDDGRITDNVFVNSAGKTIQLYPDAQRTHVANNVIDGGRDTVRGGIVIGGGSSTASKNNVVERNIITYAATYNVYSNWEGPVGSGNIVRNNCLWGARQGNIDDNGGLIVGYNLSADPRFRNRANRDYRLAADSPCLNVVGYDTAARLGGDTTAPQPAPTAPKRKPTTRADSVRPVVSWTAPTEGQVVRGTLTVPAGSCRVKASDAAGVVRVRFAVGATSLGSDSSAPWNCAWDTSKVADGLHTLKATAYDAAGNATSATVTVSVENSIATIANETRWVGLLDPAGGSTFGDSTFGDSPTKSAKAAKAPLSLPSLISTRTECCAFPIPLRRTWAASVWLALRLALFGFQTAKSHNAADVTATAAGTLYRLR